MINFQERQNLEKTSEKTKVMLKNLEKSIDSLVNMEVGINFSDRTTAYDLVLIADFNNEDDLNSYRVHPEHVNVLDFLKINADKTAVVDYYF
jgi:hypothetical protein